MSFARRALQSALAEGYRVDLETGLLVTPDGHTLVGRSSGTHGYRQACIRLSSGGVAYIYLHRLAAYQLWGEDLYERGACVTHRNGDVNDNRSSNLELTQRVLLVHSQRHREKALSPAQVDEIRTAYATSTGRRVPDGMCSEFARRFGVSRSAISYTGRRKS